MSGVKWGWLGVLVVACGICASTVTADLQRADPPVSLQVGHALVLSALAPKQQMGDYGLEGIAGKKGQGYRLVFGGGSETGNYGLAGIAGNDTKINSKRSAR